jgi:hypothetical protein
MEFANLSAHSPPTVAAAGPQKAVPDSSPHPVYRCIDVYIYISISIYMLSFQDVYIYGKQKFVFLGQQTVNNNQRLLCQQTCPSKGSMCHRY